jgi:transcriptional antiterminator RfaH
MNSHQVFDALSWYALHTNPRQEDRADLNLKAWQVETLNPKMMESKLNKNTGQRSYQVKPLFPGYIFAKFKAYDMLHKIRYTRGVCMIVSFGGTPLPVDEDIIHIIRRRMGEAGMIKIQDDFKRGTPIMIQEGRFKGLTGIFEHEMSGSDRIRVLLDAISCQVHLDIEKHMVKAVGR